MVFFVDTNFFLQCKKYDQLSWNDITDDKNIIILIARPVQIEIDKLKNNGKSRRAKRARETTKLFHDMLNTNNLSLQWTIRQKEITISFAKNYSAAELEEFSNGLDITSNDDKILATVRKYISTNKTDTDTCCFLTKDSNPLVTAKTNDIPAIEIPDEWLLEPENDERDKKIIMLEKQIQELQNKEPQISFEFSIRNGQLLHGKTNEYEVAINQYIPLEKKEIDELAHEFYKKHPKQTDFEENKCSNFNSAIHTMEKYYPPAEDAIEKYNSAYDDWKNKIYRMIDDYAASCNNLARAFYFKAIIRNRGTVPAKDLFVNFSILSGGLLERPSFKMQREYLKRNVYPSPPEPPIGTWKSIYEKFEQTIIDFIAPQRSTELHSYQRLLAPLSITEFKSPQNPVRNKYAFGWNGDMPKNHSAIWKFVCDEFRHKTEPREFNYYMLFDEDADVMKFRISWSAFNLASPSEVMYTIHKKIQLIDTKQEIIQLLNCGVVDGVIDKIE